MRADAGDDGMPFESAPLFNHESVDIEPSDESNTGVGGYSPRLVGMSS